MKKHKLVVPPGIDSRAFHAFNKKTLLELNNDFKAFHNANVERSKRIRKSVEMTSPFLNIPEKEAKDLLTQHIRSAGHVESIKAFKKRKPLTGHNPARYAPYAFPWSYLDAGGIGGASLYDVNAGDGSLGADLSDYFGGSGSAASALGFWYQAQHTGNLFVSSQIYIDGAAEVYAFPGYATANAFVKVFVQQWQPWNSISAQSTIYDRSAYAFSIDVDNNISGYYSASITVPIVAGRWYCLWAALYQHVTAGGISSAVSNFRGYVGPITYVEV
jgi:hypothetical protein